MIRIGIPVLTIALCALAPSPAAAQLTLRYKFKEGETLNYAMDRKMKMTISVMDKNIDMSMDQTANMSWKIDSVDQDGTAKITITFGRMKMSIDSPMGKVEVDSQDADAPEGRLGSVLHGVVKAMAGMATNGKINARGEITDVQVPEKVAKQLSNLPGADTPLGQILSPDGLKQMMSQSGLVLPKEAVAKGGKWNHKMDMKLPFGKVGAEFNYVYDGPTDKGGRTFEKIGLKPKMTIDPDADALFAMKMKSQEGSGHALFDNVAGQLKEVTINQTMEFEIDVMGQTISQRMVQNVVTRLVQGGKAAAPDNNALGTLDTLLLNRRDTIRQLVKLVEEECRERNASVDTVIHAYDQLLNAELDLATERDKRVAIMELQVKRLADLEQTALILFQAEHATPQSVLAVKLAKLHTHIQLMQETDAEPAKRIPIHEQQIKLLTDAQRVAERRYQAGDLKLQDLLKVTAARLNAEIALRKELDGKQ